jgi:hypothetical protein
MNNPIYQIFYIKNSVAANQAWKALSETERSALIEQERASRAEVKAKEIVFCNSAWADEEHPAWGVLSFPDLAGRIQHTRTLQKIGWLDIVESFTLLGTSDSEPEAVTFSNPIYKLWIIKIMPAGTAAYSQLSKGLEAALWEKHNLIYDDTGSQMVLSCSSYWCNEAYPYFGISAYPSIEANQKVMQCLDELGWQRYFDVFTLLGLSEEF